MMKQRDALPLTLFSGQCEQVLLDAGSRIVVLAGQATVRQPPRWLAEQTLGLVSTLTEGEHMMLDEGGWVEVVARSACRALVLPPAPGILARLIDWVFAEKVADGGESDVDQGTRRLPRTESRFASVPGALFKEP